jgi:endonuclease YncB( thermonuclease family)
LAAPEGDELAAPRRPGRWSSSLPANTSRCELNGERTHDRCVAVCFLEGSDLAAEMVRAGLARDCPRFSGGRYRGAEAQASAAGATIGESYRLPGYCRPR